MASGDNRRELNYSCKCLNIRIRAANPQTSSPQVTTDPQYNQIYVGEEGIVVAHPQLTLRIRAPGVPIAGTPRCSRYTSLTCLICQVLVYRVHQIVPHDVEGKEGPLLPTEDWVEEEVMKSASGWIEIHVGCLTGDAIAQAGASNAYSSTFSVILPSVSPLPAPVDSTLERPSPRSTQSPPPSPRRYISHMRPLFPPPPFTPSQPVFLHLASLATNRSQVLRSAAEERLSAAVRDEIAKVECAEAELRLEVEMLWRTFRESIHKFGQERSQTTKRSPIAWSQDTETRSGADGPGTHTHGTHVAIRDFVPLSTTVSKPSPPTSVPKVSSLSVSLAKSSFHHPAMQDQTSSSQRSRPHSSASSGSSLSSGSSRTLSSSSASRESSSLRPPSEGSNVLQFKRNVDDSLNTAVSYRYFTDLEAEMARHKRVNQIAASDKQQEAGQTQDSATEPVSQVAGPSTRTNGNKKHKRNFSGSTSSIEPTQTRDQGEEHDAARGPEPRPHENGSSPKPKRKVTFDVQPAIVTIKREVNAEKEEEAKLASQDTGEMMFDLEDEGTERSIESRSILPLIDQAPFRPVRPPTSRTNNTVGLSGSFSTLRPSSLPNPSHIRPPWSHQGSDSSLPTPRPEPPRTSLKAESPGQDAEEEQEPLDPREAEILKLVAADTPSHRGAWKRDSKAWLSFIRRQGAKLHPINPDISEEEESGELDSNQLDDYDEEDESGDNFNESTFEDSAVVGSLAIPIRPWARPKETLTLASYQTNVITTEQDKNSTYPRNKVSSKALRKAVYAQRDRTRSMDPGALDFADEDDEDDERDNDDESPTDPQDSGLKGRKWALKILQARSKLPEAGMWRSLA